MKCPNCGCETSGNFCSECGTPLTTDEQNQTNDNNNEGAQGTPYFDGFTQADVNPNQTYGNTAYTEQQPPQKKKMSGGKIAIIVVSIVVAVLLIFGTITAVIVYNLKNMVTSVTDSITDIIPTINKDDVASQIDGIAGQIESQISDYAQNENFIYSDTDGGKKLIAYYVGKDGATDKLVIPSEKDGKQVVAVGAFFSAAANYFSEVEIPDTVTTIDSNAFCGCDKLKSVTIPESVTSIGKYAFGYTVDINKIDMKKTDGFTIYGAKGSTAETYANDNGFEFIEK